MRDGGDKGRSGGGGGLVERWAGMKSDFDSPLDAGVSAGENGSAL